jgi:hypothetical protein
MYIGYLVREAKFNMETRRNAVPRDLAIMIVRS